MKNNISLIDESTEETLRNIYAMFNSSEHINVSSPKYDKTQIDMLVDHNLLSRFDASSFSDWEYIASPTYECVWQA